VGVGEGEGEGLGDGLGLGEGDGQGPGPRQGLALTADTPPPRARNAQTPTIKVAAARPFFIVDTYLPELEPRTGRALPNRKLHPPYGADRGYVGGAVVAAIAALSAAQARPNPGLEPP